MMNKNYLPEPLCFPAPQKAVYLHPLPQSALSWIASEYFRQGSGWWVLVCKDNKETYALQASLHFFDSHMPVFHFSDWETLPYDHFSPHPDIISERLRTLIHLKQQSKGLLLVSIQTLMQRLPPKNYIWEQSFSIKKGLLLNLSDLQKRLVESGYYAVEQVFRPGEFAVRGSIMDIFPTGSKNPIRLDFLDDEIDSIRLFDVETQLSIEKLDEFECLPAHEFPFDEKAISRFRSQFREITQLDPMQSEIYRTVSQKRLAQGIEYYMPLFFEKTETLFDYFNQNAQFFLMPSCYLQAENFWQTVQTRYESLRHDLTRPLLPPAQIYLTLPETFSQLKKFPQVVVTDHHENSKSFGLSRSPKFLIQEKPFPVDALQNYLKENQKRILMTVESKGRREVWQELFERQNLKVKTVNSWGEWVQEKIPLGITLGELVDGFQSLEQGWIVVPEQDLLGEQKTVTKREKSLRDPDLMIRQLSELKIGDLVVHLEQGIGRYEGLTTLTTGDQTGEFLTLEYANNAKLYVPITALDRISRYSTAQETRQRELNKLGSQNWEKTKEKAAKKIWDVAAELLHIYAKREHKEGTAFTIPSEYQAFSESFPFEETPDQLEAINAVLSDLKKPRPMDRVVCGDVGFGKTEVAMRAAFVVASHSKQVVMLVPTTLLAEQHLKTFKDRFADWPFKIEALSRFRNSKEQSAIKKQIQEGKIDIIIGTHSLLQSEIQFHDLGLLIVDEEHRFGVRQKERIKALCTHVDLLTLTATPIPRTLNMALSGIRDLSVIATPPLKRLAIKTFLHVYDQQLIKEAITRELVRGGQVYFLNNDIKSLHYHAETIQKMLPDCQLAIAHGQMPETELEKIMRDFYHQRFQLLLCTTIIESGIHVPTANTIIINRADHLGLAQLHQIRGRVGRSHHQAYAYLLIPDEDLMTQDAKKRLEAISALEELGSGFILANHDLEIRGAGELLGSEQSGQIDEIGFNLYMEMLDHAVKSLKEGKEPEDLFLTKKSTEIELPLSAYIPNNYIADVSTRLTFYKRLAGTKNEEGLQNIQIELIDRFGPLPEETKHLFSIQHLRLKLDYLGIQKMTATSNTIRLDFKPEGRFNIGKIIQLIQTQPNQFKLNQKNQFFYTSLQNPIHIIEEIHQLLRIIE